MMKRANQALREYIRQSGVFQYEIAERLRIHETAFCKRMRKELPKEEVEQIVAIIQDIVGSGS